MSISATLQEIQKRMKEFSTYSIYLDFCIYDSTNAAEEKGNTYLRFATNNKDDEKYFMSLRNTKNGTGKANNFTFAVAFIPSNLGKPSSSTVNGGNSILSTNYIDTALSLATDCKFRYGYTFPDGQSIVSPWNYGTVTDYTTEIRDGYITYTITGYSNLCLLKEKQINKTVEELQAISPTGDATEIVTKLLEDYSTEYGLGYKVINETASNNKYKCYSNETLVSTEVKEQYLFDYINNLLNQARTEEQKDWLLTETVTDEETGTSTEQYVDDSVSDEERAEQQKSLITYSFVVDDCDSSYMISEGGTESELDVGNSQPTIKIVANDPSESSNSSTEEETETNEEEAETNEEGTDEDTDDGEEEETEEEQRARLAREAQTSTAKGDTEEIRFVFDWMSGRSDDIVQNFSTEFKGAVAMAVAADKLKYDAKDLDSQNVSCSISGDGSVEKVMQSYYTKTVSATNGDSYVSDVKATVAMLSLFESQVYTANLTTLGIPDDIPILTRFMITPLIYGAAHHTAGVYYVNKQEDSISAQGYTSAFELCRVGASNQFNEKMMKKYNKNNAQVMSADEWNTAISAGDEEAQRLLDEYESYADYYAEAIAESEEE